MAKAAKSFDLQSPAHAIGLEWKLFSSPELGFYFGLFCGRGKGFQGFWLPGPGGKGCFQGWPAMVFGWGIHFPGFSRLGFSEFSRQESALCFFFQGFSVLFF
ncbi:MAG: hypothetical protein JW744_01475 [Candidatus Diapherotrites archaeon]|uniref:Uncharacterized protein n=1 Tax=Candidatus Iainarchaeum sp. TaxID=3101447 RepID=A0A938YVZ2_9ARCH|nr:hypothetical protein [Candidatus Diapherotrites archaeon]